jgi:hypothetical protein
MARATLKTQEILAKKWALLRASPNGLWAVFAGFLCVFKFTGSAAPRLGGLTRLFERIFFGGINIFNFLKYPEEYKGGRLCFLSLCLDKNDGKWEISVR